MALTRTRFIFLRHGETEWNARGLSQGNVDVPLNERGWKQARAAAAALRGQGIATIVHSPLSRARDTAAVIAEALQLPLHEDPDLREAAFGVQEGQPNGAWFAHWIMGSFTPVGGESFSVLSARAVAAINRALARKPLVLVVGHGAFFRAIRAAMGLAIDVKTPNAEPLLAEPAEGEREAWRLTPLAVPALEV
ncbi:MAG: histidine phosphatase family protein [Elioraea sp.]|nr:histidine phosphatase family protein [Elioraea sp.]